MVNTGPESSEKEPKPSWLRNALGFLSPKKDQRKELVELLHKAESKHVIDNDTVSMMEGALIVSETQVREIMVPKSEIVFIDEDTEPEDFVPQIVESGHSRFPVFDDDRENIIGILLAKDLLHVISNREVSFRMRDIIRPVSFVPESKRLNVLLREFREKRNHLAVVVDEYGEVSGLLTIEDVLEQIVGEIDDEHDFGEDSNIRQHRHNRYTVKARTTLEEFNEAFETDIISEDFDTIGGLVIHSLGHLPVRGEEVGAFDFNFKVLRADSRRVRLLRVIRESGQ
jgi:magnesium and cobalt transporter